MDKSKPAEQTTAEQPTMGGFEGREHHYPIRVFYEDTDYLDNRIMSISVNFVE